MVAFRTQAGAPALPTDPWTPSIRKTVEAPRMIATRLVTSRMVAFPEMKGWPLVSAIPMTARGGEECGGYGDPGQCSGKFGTARSVRGGHPRGESNDEVK